jgi:hypothetical protein
LDGGNLFSIVDEHGRWLGDSLPQSIVTVRVSPGAHEFIGYPPRSLPDGPDRNVWPWVVAIRGDVVAGRLYCVELRAHFPDRPRAHPVRMEFAVTPRASLEALRGFDVLEPDVADAGTELEGDIGASRVVRLGEMRLANDAVATPRLLPTDFVR